MDQERWRGMRESGFRVLFAGIFSLIIAFVIYARITAPSSEPVIYGQYLTNVAYGILAITGASIASAMYGAYTILRSEGVRTAGSNSLIAFITSASASRGFWKIVVVAALGYGIFFGFLSQVLVYRADVSFTEKGITVPSADLIPCCGLPGYVPMLTLYLTDHFLILFIPLNVILATVVSALVGFNVALSLFAFRVKRSLHSRTSLVGGMGATSGLFIGCPTCAASIFSGMLGVGITGAGPTVAVLAPFQILFIAASIPALVIAPLLIARSIRSVSSCKLS